jgi:hypothetical protein
MRDALKHQTLEPRKQSFPLENLTVLTEGSFGDVDIGKKPAGMILKLAIYTRGGLVRSRSVVFSIPTHSTLGPTRSRNNPKNKPLITTRISRRHAPFNISFHPIDKVYPDKPPTSTNSPLSSVESTTTSSSHPQTETTGADSEDVTAVVGLKWGEINPDSLLVWQGYDDPKVVHGFIVDRLGMNLAQRANEASHYFDLVWRHWSTYSIPTCAYINQFMTIGPANNLHLPSVGVQGVNLAAAEVRELAASDGHRCLEVRLRFGESGQFATMRSRLAAVGGLLLGRVPHRRRSCRFSSRQRVD